MVTWTLVDGALGLQVRCVAWGLGLTGALMTNGRWDLGRGLTAPRWRSWEQDTRALQETGRTPQRAGNDGHVLEPSEERSPGWAREVYEHQPPG